MNEMDKVISDDEVPSSNVSDNNEVTESCQVSIKMNETLHGIVKKVEEKRRLFKQKGRSMSDGETKQTDDANFQVFPTLPNSVIEKLEHDVGQGCREQINEEELEEKFTNLALAFTIDGATIKDRWERQKRARNQTENNFNVAIEKLREKLTLMEPLCTDYEKAEIFSTIVSQVDIILKAASLAMIAAERFGCVQKEERLIESVGIMVNHVKILKQQRDATKKQLQYTKRVLQNSADSPRVLNPRPANNQSPSPTSSNAKIISKRRASIATFSQQTNDCNPNKSVIEVKKIARRTSELNLKANAFNKWPTRFESGGELNRIKERIAELSNENDKLSDENDCPTIQNISSSEEIVKKIDISKMSFRNKILYKFDVIRKTIEEKYNVWTVNENLHEMCTFCAIICLSLSVILLFNILIEYEYAKKGIV